MPDLHIRNVDPEVIARLKAQAKRNGRSMEAEAREIVTVGCPRRLPPKEWVEMMRQVRAEHPIPWSPGDPTALELLREAREERDSRLGEVTERRSDEADDRR